MKFITVFGQYIGVVISSIMLLGGIWPLFCNEVLLWSNIGIITHHPFLSLSLLSPSGGVLSGFWFEFSCAHCCGCGTQLPNHPSANLLPDWPAEESYWLPVCITTCPAAVLPTNPGLPFTTYFTSSSSNPVGFLILPCKQSNPPVSNMFDCHLHLYLFSLCNLNIFLNGVSFIPAWSHQKQCQQAWFGVSTGCLK